MKIDITRDELANLLAPTPTPAPTIRQRAALACLIHNAARFMQGAKLLQGGEREAHQVATQGIIASFGPLPAYKEACQELTNKEKM